MSTYRTKFNPFTKKLQWVTVGGSGSGLTFKESVPTYADLPATGNTENDARIVNDTQHLYVWNSSAWIDQGDFININWGSIGGTLSDQTDLKDELDSLENSIDEKLDKLNSESNVDALLALNFEGEDGATTLSDLSGRHSVSFLDTAEISTQSAIFGLSSLNLTSDPGGTNDGHILINNNASDWNLFANASANATIQFWLKLKSLTNDQYVICAKTDPDGLPSLGTHYWRFTIRPGSNSEFTVSGGSQILIATSNLPIDIDTWHHYAIIKSGTDVGLYVDGVQKGYMSQGARDLNTISNLAIGKSQNNGSDCYIDELEITQTNTFSASPNGSLTDSITLPQQSIYSEKIAYIKKDGTIERTTIAKDKLEHVITSRANGNWKKVTGLSYNPTTGDIRVEYEQ